MKNEDTVLESVIEHALRDVQWEDDEQKRLFIRDCMRDQCIDAKTLQRYALIANMPSQFVGRVTSVELARTHCYMWSQWVRENNEQPETSIVKQMIDIASYEFHAAVAEQRDKIAAAEETAAVIRKQAAADLAQVIAQQNEHVATKRQLLASLKALR